MSTTIASLEVTIGANTSGLSSGLSDARSQITGFASDVGGNAVQAGAVLGTALTRGFQSAAGGMDRFLDSPIDDMIMSAANAAIEWESAFAGVEKTVEGTATQMAALEEGIRGLAVGESPVAGLENAAIELAEIAELAGQLGVARDDILGFTETIGMLTMSTNLTGDAAATMAAQFANITGMDMGNISNLGSTIVDLGNNMATTESDIMAFGQRLAGIGANVGMAEPEILALGAAMASLGLEAEAGGTAATTILNTLATEAANAGPALQTIADIAGTTSGAFAELMAADPSAALQGFVEGFGELDVSEQTAALEALGLSGIRTADTMRRLGNNSELLGSAMSIANSAWAENTALMTEAETRMATTESAMNRAGNAVNELGITLGETFAPAIADGAGALTDFTSALGNIQAGDSEAAFQSIENGMQGVLDMVTSLTGLELPSMDAALAGWSSAFENAGNSIRIVIDRIRTAVEVAFLDIRMGLLDSVAGMRDSIMEISGVDIAPQIDVEIARLQAEQAGYEVRDAFSTAIQGAASTGEFDFSEVIDTMFTQALGAGGSLPKDIGDIEIDFSSVRLTDSAAIAFDDAFAQALSGGDFNLIQNLIDVAGNNMDQIDMSGLFAQVGEAIQAGSMDVFDAYEIMLAIEATAGDIDLGSLQSDIMAAVKILQLSSMGAVNAMVDVIIGAGGIDASPLMAAISDEVARHTGGGGMSVRRGAGGGVDVGRGMGGMQVPHFALGGMMQNDGLAFLHAGERVLNPQETRAYNRGQGGNTIILNNSIYGQSPYDVMQMVTRAARGASY